LSVVGFIVVACIVIVKSIGKVVIDAAISAWRGGARMKGRRRRIGDLDSSLRNLVLLVLVVGIYLSRNKQEVSVVADKITLGYGKEKKCDKYSHTLS
jgi:hypothetical protein